MSYYSGPERRAVVRVLASVPISFITEDGTTVTGHTVDISSKGIGFILYKPVEARIEYHIDLTLPHPELTEGEIVPCSIYLVYCSSLESEGNGTSYRFGGIISQLPRKSRAKLEEFIKSVSDS